MRLTYIKLAGFKSFVDPTKVPFEQQMTAIVGPNGCGKSNIIDAVRWVLGESSAKHLRGDAMTDVIFNGAASRKPVGQASVELMFDNMAHRIQGSMADRNQVSIRRVVNRDGQNTYYLNGSKCRRKDITDIFLGTGLGPRSYAIIEQGTISRLIESKPQELRVFIEEAAGISKYKERRRETENRIRHTRENLARLTDIRFELTQQIDKLHQQAEAAKRFRTLKSLERRLKSELAVLRWQSFDKQARLKREAISELNQEIAALKQTQQTDIALITGAKTQIQNANSLIQQCQQEKIVLTNDIAKSEQQITHEKLQAKQQQERAETLNAQLQETQHLIAHEQSSHIAAQNTHKEQLIESEILKAQLDEKQQQQELEIQEINKLQHEYQQLNAKYRTVIESEKLATAKVAELEAEAKQLKHNREIKQHQLNTVNDEIAKLLAVEKVDESLIKNELEMLSTQMSEVTRNLKEARAEQVTASKRQVELNTQEQSEQHRLNDIILQLKQTEPWQDKQATALQSLSIGLENAVQQLIDVEPGWELAAEIVIADLLNAQVFEETEYLSNLEQLQAITKQLDTSRLWIKSGIVSSNDRVGVQSLADKITSEELELSFLNKVLVVEDEAACFKKLSDLSREQSVICPQGLWLSHQFCRKGMIGNNNQSLTLQNEQTRLLSQQVARKQQIDDCAQYYNQAEQRVHGLEHQQQQFTDEINAKQQLLIEVTQINATWQQQHKQLSQQQVALTEETSAIEQALQDAEMRLVRLSGNEETSTIEPNDFIASLEHVEHQISQRRNTLQDIISRIQTLKDALHQQTLLIERSKYQEQQAQHNISRYQATIEHITKQQADNHLRHGAPAIDIKQMNEQLQQWLKRAAALDEEIAEQQQVIVQQQSILQQMEQNTLGIVEKIDNAKQEVAELTLNAESFRIKAGNALAQLEELGQQQELVAESLPTDAKESIWQAKLVKVQNDIQQLGAINLAAIDEYESQLMRKNYLDQQDQDLNQAISTLESAIAKIDRESRQKFKTTFDKVNQDLQSLFPKVFGGGDAYLALTGEDLLETGVTIMARPPGKKNSTIHLLSGGEKALTALSLVFAIFRLNPAPFCMLDEVDAPLDDANVGRFCNLVREMSSTVQFIYISHNKIAMEMASHLTGVTMFEPGVSRMVAVDVDEALAMAEVS